MGGFARDVASLALVWIKQDGHLRVRQTEQLRRALSAAGEFLGWGMISDNQLDAATKDVAKLAKRGTRMLTVELADEVASKKAEINELKKQATAFETLAEKGDFSDPLEVNYSHTAGRAPEDLVTKIATITITEPQEARDAAAQIEKKIEAWTKLRDAMLVVLKRRQRELDDMAGSLAPFVDSSRQLLSEVLITMH